MVYNSGIGIPAEKEVIPEVHEYLAVNERGACEFIRAPLFLFIPRWLARLLTDFKLTCVARLRLFGQKLLAFSVVSASRLWSQECGRSSCL